jgi:SulP family sulfate permease
MAAEPPDISDADDSPNPFTARVTALIGGVRGRLPTTSTIRSELVPGLSAAIGGVPDGMAGAVLAGVNPVLGLYASMLGPFVGGLLSSTQLLRVTSTSAAALAAGDVLLPLPPEARLPALALLVVLIGVLQVAAGLARLGRLTRFVSHSVMIGFLTGIAVLIILGQLGNFTGYEADGAGRIAQTINLALNLDQIDPASTAIGGLTLLLALLLLRTRLRLYAALIALVIPSALAVALRLESVQRVGDISAIPRGLPALALPSLAFLSVDLITAAVAIAAIILVQGAGVSQSVRNRDGSPSDASQDFIAQGAANVAVGLAGGVPVGGSVNQTAFSVLAGARSRWTSIFSGLWMALLLLAVPGLLELVAMPALAALLIVAGYFIIKGPELVSIWRTGRSSAVAIATTFVATLFLPVQAAVGIGAALSALLHLNQAATDIRLVELTPLPDGRTAERPAPDQLPSNAVTVLQVYGSLFYAGARTFESRLPAVRGATRPAVVLRLRGLTTAGATLIDVLARYAADLETVGGRLYLTGLAEPVPTQLARAGKLSLGTTVHLYAADDIIGEATRRAVADAEAWLAQPPDQRPRDSE